MRSRLIVSGPVYCTSIERIFNPPFCAWAGAARKASRIAKKMDDATLRDRPTRCFIKWLSDGRVKLSRMQAVLVGTEREIVKGEVGQGRGVCEGKVRHI